jgi:hypothetical protein
LTGGVLFLLLSFGGTFRSGVSFASIIALGFLVFAFSGGGLAAAIILTGRRYSLLTQVAVAAVLAAAGTFLGVSIARLLFEPETGNTFREVALGFSLLESFLCGGMAWGLDFATRQGKMPREIDVLRSAFQRGEINDQITTPT